MTSVWACGRTVITKDWSMQHGHYTQTGLSPSMLFYKESHALRSADTIGLTSRGHMVYGCGEWAHARAFDVFCKVHGPVPRLASQ